MKRVPIVIVALILALALTAGAGKWRARRLQRASRTTATPPPDGSADPRPLAGLGAGPPPEGIDGSHGAPMLHGDSRHTHRADGRAPASPPAVVWSHAVGGPVEAQVTTSADEQTLYAASLGGSIVALSRADGSERWRFQLGDRGYGAPLVGPDGTVYVGSDAKKFYALTPEGNVRWSLESEGEADTAPVMASDGTIVFAAGRMVYAVTRFGQIKWRFAAKRKVFASPAVATNGRVFFGSQDHKAYAVSPEGRLLWSTDLGGDVDGAPAIGDDGSVFVGTDADDVVRLEPDRGGIVWRAKLGGYVRGALSVARNGDVLAGTYGPTPRAVRLRAADGSVAGQFAIQGTGAREFGVHGGALEDAAGTLLFGTQDDDVYAVDARGDVIWRYATEGDVDAPVTLLSDGDVVIGSDDGKVYLLRAM